MLTARVDKDRIDPEMKTRSSTAVWSAVHSERRALIRDLQKVPDLLWRTPSLCEGWDVHDVLAHLIATAKTTRLGFVRSLLVSRFDFDRDNEAGIAREKTQNPASTLDEFRMVVDRTSTPPVALATRLVEAFVHGEDIRRPLGISSDYPPGPVITALGYQVRTSTKMGGGKEPAKGSRLVASDAPFEHGDGPEVRGPAIALLLAVSGRPVNPNELTWPGAQAFITKTGVTS